MAILINDNYSLSATKPFDARYMNISTPWASTAEVIAAIPTYRYQGLTVNINGVEYWWKDGVDDADLVPKVLGGASNLSGATNGLSTFSGNTLIGLGGVLSQNTTICGAHDLCLGTSSSGLTGLYAITPTFEVSNGALSGSSICFAHDANTPHLDVCLYGESSNSCAGLVLDVDNLEGYFNVYNAPNNICSSNLCLQTTNDNIAVFDINTRNALIRYDKKTWISTLCRQTHETISSAIDGTENIQYRMDYGTRSFNFMIDDTDVLKIVSGGTARYDTDVNITNDYDLIHKKYLDSSLTGVTASNGLSNVGGDIVLGGDLTSGTTIGLSGYSLNIKDNNEDIQLNMTGNSAISMTAGLTELQLNNENWLRMCAGSNILQIGTGATIYTSSDNTGIKYATCYHSGYTNRSLVDKEYVLKQVSGSTGKYNSVSNGLTAYGSNITFGGTLTGNTSISGNSSYIFTLDDMSGFTVCSDKTLTCASTSICLETPSLIINNGFDEIINISNTGNTIGDPTNSIGFVYCSNYSSNGGSNPRWIPDAQWVTGLTSQAITTANNGLYSTGDEIHLGGALTGNTTINGAGNHNLCIINSGATTCTVAEFTPTNINICARNVINPNQTSKINANLNSASICHGFTNCYSSLNMTNSKIDMIICGGTNNASFTVTDKTTETRGIQYAACYHSGYTNRSLVDKEYVIYAVNSGVTGITNSAITGATNGLCKSLQEVKLGGSLTENTIINGSSNSLSFSGLSEFNVSGTSISLSGNTTVGGSLTVGNVSSGDTSTDTVLVKDTNGQVKYVNVCEVGITSASNGVCVSGGNFVLGGGLTGNTFISGNSNYISFSDLTEFNVTGTSISLSGNTTVGGSLTISNISSGDTSTDTVLVKDTNGQVKYVNVCEVGITSASNGISISGDNFVLGGGLTGDTFISGNSNYISFSDLTEFNVTGTSISLSGDTTIGGNLTIDAISSGDTSTDTVLVRDTNGQVKYVNVCEVGIASASNGISISGDNFVLGGGLTGDTILSGSSNILSIIDLSEFNLSSASINVTGDTTIDGSLTINSGATINGVGTGDINTDEVLVIGSNGDIKKITGTSLNVSASNGITASNNDVKLGGVLSENTVISGATQSLDIGVIESKLNSICGFASSDIEFNAVNLKMSGSTTGDYIGGSSCLSIGINNTYFYDNTANKTGIRYSSCISTGFTSTCSLVDKGYVDDASNTVAVNNVQTTYTANRSDDFIGVSGASTINLPSNPKACQRIIIADICGNALTENITVVGNGLCINGSSTAIINTDYGAMTLINNGYSWSAIAFIN